MLTITKYVANRTIRLNTPYCNGFWILEGKKITDAEFNKLYPIEGKFVSNETALRFKGHCTDPRKVTKFNN
jgi:hypothetical protein